MTNLSTSRSTSSTLSIFHQLGLFFTSLLIVGFGQSVFAWWIGVIAAAAGYSLFFRILLSYDAAKSRFWLATGWFACVQLIQYTWVLSHPFIYMYALYFFFSFFFGMQFGLIGALFQPSKATKITHLVFLAALWTIFEWIRLLPFAGLCWNLAGLALAGNLYSLQTASLWGMYGLTFWVILTNFLALRGWIQCNIQSFLIWLSILLFPYLFGFIQLTLNDHFTTANKNEQNSTFAAVLVQPGFSVEEQMAIKDGKSFYLYVLNAWKQILKIIKQQKGHSIDLMVFPESTVPYGAYSFIYPQKTVENIFSEIFGSESLHSLPSLEEPTLALKVGSIWMVNNAYWAQALANYFETGILIGFQDADKIGNLVENYNSAIYFQPHKNYVFRYDKRILLPMGEYIPFSFLRDLAAKYNIYGSTTPGKEAKVFTECKVPFGPSICYEEILGHFMRENKNNGAKLLINLTNDGWYPGKGLPQRHFDLSQLRTVENGLPLLRACNTGVTGAIDSTGRIIAILGADDPNQDKISDSLFVTIPTYHYQTLYSFWGDWLIIGFSSIAIILNIMGIGIGLKKITVLFSIVSFT
jgi:apolipoprotein N-acyltransferase